MTLHNLAGYLFGYWSARGFGMVEADARTVAIEVGLQNAGMASGLAISVLHSSDAGLAAAIFGPWMNISGSVLASWWRKRPIEAPGGGRRGRRAMKRSVRRLLDRRHFFRSVGTVAGGAAAATFARAAEASAAENAAIVQSNVKRASEPSALKITDLRVAVVVKAPMTCPIIRIDTNQGLVGWGEVRDGASETYALILKSRLLGENPCNVDKVFRKIKQFGAPARQAGGVCGVEMALMDLAGKAWGVPVLADARRQVPRSRAALRRHDRDRGSEGAGPAIEGADGSRPHVPEAGLRHRPAEGQAGHAQHAVGRGPVGRRLAAAPVHGRADHRQGDRVPLRLDRHDRGRSSAWTSRSPPITTATSR